MVGMHHAEAAAAAAAAAALQPAAAQAPQLPNSEALAYFAQQRAALSASALGALAAKPAAAQLSWPAAATGVQGTSGSQSVVQVGPYVLAVVPAHTWGTASPTVPTLASPHQAAAGASAMCQLQQNMPLSLQLRQLGAPQLSPAWQQSAPLQPAGAAADHSSLCWGSLSSRQLVHWEHSSSRKRRNSHSSSMAQLGIHHNKQRRESDADEWVPGAGVQAVGSSNSSAQRQRSSSSRGLFNSSDLNPRRQQRSLLQHRPRQQEKLHMLAARLFTDEEQQQAVPWAAAGTSSGCSAASGQVVAGHQVLPLIGRALLPDANAQLQQQQQVRRQQQMQQAEQLLQQLLPVEVSQPKLQQQQQQQAGSSSSGSAAADTDRNDQQLLWTPARLKAWLGSAEESDSTSSAAATSLALAPAAALTGPILQAAGLAGALAVAEEALPAEAAAMTHWLTGADQAVAGGYPAADYSFWPAAAVWAAAVEQVPVLSKENAERQKQLLPLFTGKLAAPYAAASAETADVFTAAAAAAASAVTTVQQEARGTGLAESVTDTAAVACRGTQQPAAKPPAADPAASDIDSDAACISKGTAVDTNPAAAAADSRAGSEAASDTTAVDLNEEEGVGHVQLPAKDAQPGDYKRRQPNSSWDASAYEAAAAAAAAKLAVPLLCPPRTAVGAASNATRPALARRAAAAAAVEGPPLPAAAATAEFGVLMLAHEKGAPLAAAWEAWESFHAGRVVVLVHLKHGVQLPSTAPGSAWISQRQLATRVASKWGDITLTSAVLAAAAEMLQRCPYLQHIAIVSGQDVPVASLQLPLPSGASMFGSFQFGRVFDAAAQRLAAARLRQRLGMDAADADAWGAALTFHHTWMILGRQLLLALLEKQQDILKVGAVLNERFMQRDAAVAADEFLLCTAAMRYGFVQEIVRSKLSTYASTLRRRQRQQQLQQAAQLTHQQNGKNQQQQQQAAAGAVQDLPLRRRIKHASPCCSSSSGMAAGGSCGGSGGGSCITSSMCQLPGLLQPPEGASLMLAMSAAAAAGGGGQAGSSSRQDCVAASGPAGQRVGQPQPYATRRAAKDQGITTHATVCAASSSSTTSSAALLPPRHSSRLRSAAGSTRLTSRLSGRPDNAEHRPVDGEESEDEEDEEEEQEGGFGVMLDCTPTLALFHPTHTRHPHTWRNFSESLLCDVVNTYDDTASNKLTLLQALGLVRPNGALFLRKVEVCRQDKMDKLLALLQLMWQGKQLPDTLG